MNVHREVKESAADPNPIVRVTPLRAYPGWRVRQYANGMYDATNDRGLSPGFDSFAETVAHVRGETVGNAPQSGEWADGDHGGNLVGGRS